MPLDPFGSGDFRRLNPSEFPPDAKAEQLKALVEAGRAVLTDGKDERDLQKACEHELTRRNIWFLHLSPKAREKSGTPDLLFPHPLDGIFCGVELKSETGVVSDEQNRALTDILICRGRTAIIRCYADFVRFLSEQLNRA